MALINCPECQKEVSDKATKCTNCGIRLKKPKRTVLGKLIKYAFVLFNLWMAYVVWHYVSVMLENKDIPVLAQAFLKVQIRDNLFIWGIGAVILGLFVFLTRPKE